MWEGSRTLPQLTCSQCRPRSLPSPAAAALLPCAALALETQSYTPSMVKHYQHEYFVCNKQQLHTLSGARYCLTKTNESHMICLRITAMVQRSCCARRMKLGDVLPLALTLLEIWLFFTMWTPEVQDHHMRSGERKFGNDVPMTWSSTYLLRTCRCRWRLWSEIYAVPSTCPYAASLRRSFDTVRPLRRCPSWEARRSCRLCHYRERPTDSWWWAWCVELAVRQACLLCLCWAYWGIRVDTDGLLWTRAAGPGLRHAVKHGLSDWLSQRLT